MTYGDMTDGGEKRRGEDRRGKEMTCCCSIPGEYIPRPVNTCSADPDGDGRDMVSTVDFCDDGGCRCGCCCCCCGCMVRPSPDVVFNLLLERRALRPSSTSSPSSSNTHAKEVSGLGYGQGYIQTEESRVIKYLARSPVRR